MTSRSLTEALEETLALFGESGAPLTTSEAAEALELGRRSAYDRLDRLVDSGHLETKKVGASARVWWRAPSTTTPPRSTAAASSPSPRSERAADWAAVSESLRGDAHRDVGVGVLVVDETGEVAWVNEAATRYFGLDRERVRGLDERTLVGERIGPVVEDSETFVERALAGDDPSVERLECRVPPGEGRTARRLERRTEPVESGAYAGGRVEYYRDVTGRRARERRLDRYRAVMETIDDGVYVVDDESRFLLANEAHTNLTGYDREELLGAHASLVTTEDDLERAEQRRDELEASEREVATIETELVAADGRRIPVETRFALFALGDGRYGRVGVVREISGRIERERELEQRVRQQETVADLGRRALEDRDVDDLMAEAAASVTDALDTDYCAVLDLDSKAEELLFRQGSGWEDGLVGEATVSADADDSQAAYALASREPVVVEDLAAERGFSGPDLLTGHDVRSGISTAVGSHDNPWGVLGTHDTDRRTFTDHDVTFVQSVANVLATAIERHGDEQTLLVQREQLAALVSLNRTIRGITDAVIERSTREEIERTVCEHLAAADSYELAWIGAVDVASDTVTPRAEAGVEGYLDGVTISVDPADDRSRGPTGRAFLTGEMQTTRDVDAEDDHDPWRDHVDRYDFRSSAAIPIVHGDSTYGVLNVYASRRNSFVGEERAVFRQLGEVVGHAIAAAERKRALLGDEVVELEFRLTDVFEIFGIDGGASDPISFEHTVPVEDGEFVVFGRTTEAGVETAEALVEAVPFYADVTFRDAGDETRFELRLSDPPVLSAVASLDGSVAEFVIEEGDLRLRVHLPPAADVNELVDAVSETYPGANLLRRRQLPKAGAGAPDADADALGTDLTARQRAALEAAYHAGFFEWPRDADGGEVADSLGVAPPTFHQHLRKAEKAVFGSLFAASPTT